MVASRPPPLHGKGPSLPRRATDIAQVPPMAIIPPVPVAYTIIDTCIGCTACAKKCPTETIAGFRKELHIIDPIGCVDCGLCGYVCPVNAILDDTEQVATKLKPKETPKAKVDSDLCTGPGWSCSLSG